MKNRFCLLLLLAAFAAAGVLAQAAHHKVCAHLTGHLRLGELAVAIIHKNNDVPHCGAGGIRNSSYRFQIKGIALQIAAAALDVAHLCTGGLLGYISSSFPSMR